MRSISLQFYICFVFPDDANIPATQQQGSISATLNIVGEELQFYQRTGRNATISADGKCATRPNARGEFNDAIVMSNRPLRDNELFEVTIDKMVDRWSGSIESGMATGLNTPFTSWQTLSLR